MAAAGEEAESSAAARERPRVPFARGGPVFVPFMVGPISTVPEFMSSTLREVQVPILCQKPYSSIRLGISI
jgi:snRNA-activating protein complex subunit 3